MSPAGDAGKAAIARCFFLIKDSEIIGSEKNMKNMKKQKT